MRKGRFFKYLLAAIVAIGTTSYAMAQDLGKVTITFQEKSGSYCNHLNVWDWGGTQHQAPTPVYTPNNLGLEISEYEGVHNDRNGAYIGWERGTIYFKNTFKYKVRAVEWDISRGGLFDMRGKTWFGNPSNVEPQDYTIDNKTDDSNSKIYTSGNDQYLDQISLNTENWTGGTLDLFHLKIRKLIIYYYKPEVIVSLSNIADSEGKAYALQNGKDMSVGSTGKLSASLGTKHLGRFVASDVTFKYYSANSNIATIDETTGEISAKSSGSVVLTAKMYDNAGNEISDASYVLFVFDKNEGMVWTRNNVSVYNNTTGADSWNMSNTLSSGGNDWNASSTLKGGSLIWDIESGVSGVYREFASFSVPGNALYRTIAQNISCTVSLPKYSSMDYKPIIAGSLMTEDVVEYGVRYGLEVVDLGKQNNSTSITWNTNSTADNTSSVGRYRTGSTPYTMLRGGAENNKEENKLFGFINIIKDANDNYLPLVGDSYQVGSNNNNSAIWKGDNKNGASIQEVTYNLAVMSYLWGSTIKNYPASSLFGYSGVPEYTYYAHVSFYDNYKDDEAADFIDRVTLASRGRNVAAKLSHSTFVPNRKGYTFKGWSSVKGATTIEYQDQGDFYCFDSENGGGKGEVKLYAVWQANSYKIILDKQNGQQNATFNVTYGQKISNVSVPTREGYAFRGYWTEAEYSQQTQESQATDNGEKYYNNKGVTSVIWDRTEDLTLYAHWSRKTAITFDLQGGYDWATTSAIATNGEEMPGIITPQRGGHTFVGYYEQPDGKGIQYYRSNYGNAVSARIWDKDVDHATLYAHWEPKPLKLKFTYPSGEERLIEDNKYNSSKYSSLAGAKDKNGSPIEIPKKEGFLFEGWEKQGVLVYDGDGNAVEGAYWAKNSDGILVWNCTDDQTDLTARWIEAVEVATVSIQVIRDKNYENGNIHRYVGATISGVIDIADFKGDGYITVDGIHYLSCEAVPNGDDITDNLYSVKLEDAPIWHFEETTKQDAKTGLPAYNIYTVKDGQRLYLGNRVVKQLNGQVEIMYSSLGIQTEEPDGKFTIYDAGEGKGWVCFNENSRGDYNHVLYMQTNSEHYWELENSHNNSQYKPIKLLSAGHIISGDMSTQKIISSIKDELVSPGENNDYPYAYNVDGTPNINDEDLCKGLLYVDMSTIAKVVEKNRGDLSHFRDEASKNCLFFMPKSYSNDRSDNSQILADNVIRKLTNGFESVANLVITDKVPFSSPYTFSTGSHTASYSRETSDKWGSLCLPFPVKRSGSDMKFYNLYGSDDIRLAFKSDDGTNDIPANKPIACNGSGNFTLTSNSNAVVPADNDSREYNEVVTAISCENIRELVEDGKQMTTENKPWNFKGVRFDSYVYGTEYTETLPNCPNCAKKSLVYYFSKDKFTYVNSKGRVKFAPFRAYLQAPEGSSAKTFSLLVFDEDGATDITDIIDGNAGVANGKIYDLLGRRVKTPLKGHIYIVDGKKKQY